MQEEKVNITLEYSFKVGEQTFGVAISFCQIFFCMNKCMFCKKDALTSIMKCAILSCKCAISRSGKGGIVMDVIFVMFENIA